MSGKGNNEETTVTAVNAAEWLKRKADQIADDTLPSGLAVRYKKSVSIQGLALRGQLPITLITELTEKDEVEIDLGDVVNNIDQYMGLIDAIFTAAMVSPKIGEATDLSGDVAVFALSEFEDELADKLYVMEKVMSATNALKPFRGQHGANGAGASPRKRVRKKTK